MHIMLDLETMSTAKDAAIIAIGAVRMDLTNGTLGDTFYRVVNLKSAQRAGGRIDAETVMWWLYQSEDARNAIAGNDSMLIETALKEFNEWVRITPLHGIWGNGSDFDNVILENAYNRLGWTPSWSYRQNRCYRTMAARNPALDMQVAHHALRDAIKQAKHLCEIW